jgi:FkbM family methyltransferase
VPNPAVSALQAAAGRLGLEVRRAGGETDKHRQRGLLLAHLGVTLVLDAGANVGQYAAIHLREWTGYTGRIASFEPVGASHEACAAAARSDAGWTTHPYGLSDRSASLPMTVPEGHSDLSSLHGLTPAGARFIAGTRTRVEDVAVERLDDVIDAIAGPDDRLALKLDVQGHEGAVLRGAQRTLDRVVLVECELPLLALYERQDTFEGLLGTFATAGFVPVGMRSNHVDPRTGFAVDADVFLVRAEAAAAAPGEGP